MLEIFVTVEAVNDEIITDPYEADSIPLKATR